MISLVNLSNIFSRIISPVTKFTTRPVQNAIAGIGQHITTSTQNYLERKTLVERTITEKDVKSFTDLTGDTNHVHSGIDGIVHGAFLNSLVSAVIGTKLPGLGTLVLSQNLRYPAPCPIGTTVVVTVEIISWRKIITCSYSIKDKLNDNVFLIGDARLVQKKKSSSTMS